MKALLTAEQLRRKVPGGVGTYVRGLVQGFTSEPDADIALWASRGSDSALAEFGLPVVTSRLPSKFLTRAWDKGRSAPPEGWDVIHATSLAVPPASSQPMTVTVHDVGWRTFPDAYPDRGREWHEASLKRAKERAQMIIVPSQATANDLMDDGVDQKKIAVIPLGSDHLPEPDLDGALAKLHEANVFGDYILAVGTLEPRKNLPNLIKAFERAQQHLPADMNLVIVGPPGWGKQVEQTRNVQMIPHASMAEITALYDRCRTFVSVPLLEGFGLPVLEAMSRGAPVVSSNVPSAGNATYRVDPSNIAGIAEGITRVVNDADLRYSLMDKGRAHAKEFTWGKCARRHMAVWDELL